MSEWRLEFVRHDDAPSLAETVPMPAEVEPAPVEWPSGREGVYLCDPETITFND
jgi:hypothetical protein